MKKGIKIIALLLVLVSVVCVLSACSKTGKCDNCGKTDVKVTKYKANGETAWLCKDCEWIGKLAESILN